MFDDVTVFLLLMWSWLLGLKGEVIDIETAFLCGHLKEEMRVKVPEGLQHVEKVLMTCMFACNLPFMNWFKLQVNFERN